MAIKKAVFEYLVMFDDKKVDPAFIEDSSVDEIELKAREGALLSTLTLREMKDVKPEDLRYEMDAFGNDGSSFGIEVDASPSP